VRPAIVSGEDKSTSSYKMDDFKTVAIGNYSIAIGRLRNDFEIAFDSELPRLEAELLYKIEDGHRPYDTYGFAVNLQVHSQSPFALG